MIQNKTARNILYSWHGGQYSSFYSAASSGLVESFNSIRSEIKQCINFTETVKGYTKKDKQDLINLLTWIDNKESKIKSKVIIQGSNYSVLPWVSKSHYPELNNIKGISK